MENHFPRSFGENYVDPDYPAIFKTRGVRRNQFPAMLPGCRACQPGRNPCKISFPGRSTATMREKPVDGAGFGEFESKRRGAEVAEGIGER